MDLMGDLAYVPLNTSSKFEISNQIYSRFGGGFEMLHCGADVDGVGERIRGYMK
jgi:hypothetical protein